MSSQLYVYIGPYIEANQCQMISDLVYEYESLVCDGRGELGVDEPRMCIVPNVTLPGVDRQMTFSRNDGMPVVEISATDREDEIESFRVVATPFIDKLAGMKADYTVLWGIVCCYS